MLELNFIAGLGTGLALSSIGLNVYFFYLNKQSEPKRKLPEEGGYLKPLFGSRVTHRAYAPSGDHDKLMNGDYEDQFKD